MSNEQLIPASMTMTRAHKVAERLGGELKNIEAQMACLSGVSVPAWNLKNSLPELETQKSRALAALEKFRLVSDSIRIIRAAIGQANATAGVSDRLAAQEHDRRVITAMKRFLGDNPGNQLQLAKIATIELPVAGASDHPHLARNNNVVVNLLSDDEQQRLSEALEQRRRAAHALSDELADLNQKKITISLEAEIWQLAGIDPTAGK